MNEPAPKILFFDIETLPAPPELEPTLHDLYATKPGRSRTFDEYLRGTSLSGNWGRVLCIGVAIDDAAVEVLSGVETEILKRFWELAADATLFVGHNIMEFDFPFIYKRSVVNGIRPSQNLPVERGQTSRIFDTMREWDHWSPYGHTSLHQLSLILGLESSKQGIDGSKVYDFYQAGKVQEIYDYCARDVDVTRDLYKRITYTD